MSRGWKAGEEVGGWRLERRLGAGGNGEVWVAERAGTTAALKLLKPQFLDAESRRFKRFRDEALTQARLAPRHPGVLRLLDHSIPDDPGPDTPAWLATPIATTIKDALEGAELVDAVGAVLAVAETLAGLHAEGVSHRDIKPSNLYRFDGRWVVGDLGLVDFPDKDSLTETGEKLGPQNYLAPEMFREANRADGTKADVYSLAKTLWVLATGQTTPPLGEQRVDTPQLSIGAYPPYPRVPQLDLLIERCTRHDPAARPTMREVAEELQAWLREPVARTPPDLAAILKRISQQGQQAQLNRARQEAEELFKRFGREMLPIARCFADTGLPHTPAAEHLGYAEPTFSGQVSDPPRHFWAKYAQTGMRKPESPTSLGGSLPDWVTLWCGAGLALVRDSTAMVYGGFLVGTDRTIDRVGFFNQVAPLGSSSLEAAVGELFAHLDRQLPAALEIFSRRIEEQHERSSKARGPVGPATEGQTRHEGG